jgi:hypothetical protein
MGDTALVPSVIVGADEMIEYVAEANKFSPPDV